MQDLGLGLGLQLGLVKVLGLGLGLRLELRSRVRDGRRQAGVLLGSHLYDPQAGLGRWLKVRRRWNFR